MAEEKKQIEINSLFLDDDRVNEDFERKEMTKKLSITQKIDQMNALRTFIKNELEAIEGKSNGYLIELKKFGDMLNENYPKLGILALYEKILSEIYLLEQFILNENLYIFANSNFMSPQDFERQLSRLQGTARTILNVRLWIKPE